MTQHQFDFQGILQDAKQIYQHPPRGDKCFADEVLVDYFYHDLPDDVEQTVARHIQECERCRIILLKLDVEQQRWERRLNAAYQAELQTSRRSTEPEYAMSEQYTLPEWGTLIAEYYIEPRETRTANTARTQMFKKSQHFQTEFGDIEIRYGWGEQGKDNHSFIWIGWEAELFADVTFAIRLLEPGTDTIRLEISPQTTEQTDEATFTMEQLGFDPLSTPWDMAITLFRKQEL